MNRMPSDSSLFLDAAILNYRLSCLCVVEILFANHAPTLPAPYEVSILWLHALVWSIYVVIRVTVFSGCLPRVFLCYGKNEQTLIAFFANMEKYFFLNRLPG